MCSFTLSSIPLTVDRRRKVSNVRKKSASFRAYGTIGGLRWQKGIAPLLQYSIPTAESGRKYEGLNRPTKDKDQDLQQDYGGSLSRYGSTYTSNGATPRRSPSPVCAVDFYVVETRRMYKLVRGSGILPDSARDGRQAFGLGIPYSGPVLELK